MPDKAATLLFAFYYLPDNTSGVQRAVRIAKYLPLHGYPCHVICSAGKGEQPGISNVTHVPGEITRTPETLALERWAVRIQRALLPYNEELPWVPHALAAAKHLMLREPISAVISTSPPVATHLAALVAKRRYGLKWIADFRDPILGNPGRPRRWARPYDKMLQKWIFRNADAVVAVTDVVADEWRRRYPRWAHKFHVIWNGYDPEDALRPLPAPARPFHVLSHVGVLYLKRHPNALLASVDRLISRGQLDPQSIRLRFIGPIQEQAQFEAGAAAARLLSLGCLEINGEIVPRPQANAEIASTDYLLLIDIVNLSNVGYTVPAKLYDYVLAGRPILAITSPGSPVERILAKSGVRYVCLHRETDAEADRKLIDFLRLPTDPLPPSQWFLDTFDGERQAETLAALLGPAPSSRHAN